MQNQKTICLLTIIALLISACAADPRLTTFLKKYKKINENEANSIFVSWEDKTSPFAPYLYEDFKQGFTSRQRKLYQTAVKNRNCKRIGELEQVGFLNLYPFLRPLFEDETFPGVEKARITYIFQTDIMPYKSHAFYYCESYNKIIKSYDYAKHYKFSFPTMRAVVSFKENLHETKLGKRSLAIRNYCYNMGSLISLALFKKYGPAIATVLKFTEKNNNLVLLPEMEYVFYKLAKQYRIKTSKNRLNQAQVALSPELHEKLDGFIAKKRSYYPGKYKNLNCEQYNLK